jgi:hypothetical protein
MNPSRLLLAVITLALAFLFIIAVPSAIAGKPKPKPAPPVDRRIVIKSVNAAAGTVEIEYMRDKASHTYKIDDLTSIKVNNAPGKIADIKVGMEVNDSVERDDQTLDAISVGPAQAAPVTPKTK